MKTLLLAPALFASEGGIERVMRVTLKALCDSAQNDDVIELAALNDRNFPSERMAPYSNQRLSRKLGGNRRRVFFFLQAVRACLRCDRVVIGHFHLLPVVSLAQRLKPSLRAHMFAHGIELWRTWKPSEQSAVRRGVNLLSISEFTRRRILEKCPGLAPEKINILSCPLDPTRPHDISEEPTRPGLILTVSRLSSDDRYKGIDHLIEAMPLITEHMPGAQLRIVGKGDDRPRLEQLAAQHAPNAVQFAGFVPDEKMPGEYARAHAFALPSRDEGFGLVYIEAFLQGTPCIAANAGAAPELVRPEFGALAEHGDVRGLAKACLDVMNRQWDTSQLKAHAARYSYPVFAARLTELISA